MLDKDYDELKKFLEDKKKIKADADIKAE